MTDTTRQIIDFAADDNGAEMRAALYSSIHDKVTQHLDQYKQELAKNMFNPQEEPEGATEQDVAIQPPHQEVETSEEE